MKKAVFNLPPVNIVPKVGDAVRYGFNLDPLANRAGLRPLGELPATTGRDVRRSFVGIGYETLDRDTFDPELTYTPMAETGVKWARVQTGWLKCEKEKGVYDFGWLDRVVNALLAVGIRPWFSVSFGNPLYTPVAGYETYAEDHPGEPVPHSVRGYVGEVPLYHGEEAVRGWRAYLDALGRHFAGRGSHYEMERAEHRAVRVLADARAVRRLRPERVRGELRPLRRLVESARRPSGRRFRRRDHRVPSHAGRLLLHTESRRERHRRHIGVLSYPYGVIRLQPAGAVRQPRHELDTRRSARSRYGRARPGTRRSRTTPRAGANASGEVPRQAVRRGLPVRRGMSSYFMVMDKRAYSRSTAVRHKCSTPATAPALYRRSSHGYLRFGGQGRRPLPAREHLRRSLMSHLRHVSMRLGKFRRKGLPVFSTRVPESRVEHRARRESRAAGVDRDGGRLDEPDLFGRSGGACTRSRISSRARRRVPAGGVRRSVRLRRSTGAVRRLPVLHLADSAISTAGGRAGIISSRVPSGAGQRSGHGEANHHGMVCRPRAPFSPEPGTSVRGVNWERRAPGRAARITATLAYKAVYVSSRGGRTWYVRDDQDRSEDESQRQRGVAGRQRRVRVRRRYGPNGIARCDYEIGGGRRAR